MRTSVLASALLASLTASSLVACGGSDDGAFEGASSEDRAIAVAVATGELSKGFTQIAALIGVAALETGSTCPRAVLTGTELTVTGNCTSDDDEQFVGSYVIRGFSLDGEDGSSAAGIEFRNFGFGGADSLSINGRVDVAGAADGKDQIDQDLTLSGSDDGEQRSLSVKGRLVCGADGDCAPVGEYTVDVDTIGLATVSGTWRTGTDDPQGSITLTADDALAVDFSKRDARGCFETTVDGKKVDSLCLDEDELDDDSEAEGSFRSLAARIVR